MKHKQGGNAAAYRHPKEPDHEERGKQGAEADDQRWKQFADEQLVHPDRRHADLLHCAALLLEYDVFTLTHNQSF